MDLNNWEKDFLEKIKPNFDKVYGNLKDTDGLVGILVFFLNIIYVFSIGPVFKNVGFSQKGGNLLNTLVHNSKIIIYFSF